MQGVMTNITLRIHRGDLAKHKFHAELLDMSCSEYIRRLIDLGEKQYWTKQKPKMKKL